MSGAWVAAATRARALVRRRLGETGALELGRTESFEAAVASLASGPYGHDVRPGQDPAAAGHAVAATLLWHLRVLAGWLPRQGADSMRLLARWFEIAGVDARLSGLGESFVLGTLATSWPRLSLVEDPRAARAVLATSAWGDPGGDGVRDIQLGMRLAWAGHVADGLDCAAPWAVGAAALLVARERLLEGRELNPQAAARAGRLLGLPSARAASLAEMAQTLPTAAAWSLEGVRAPEDLWRGELNWWRRLERDGMSLLADSRFRIEPVVGAVAVLAADARRTRAALALSARQAGDRDAWT